MGRRSAAPAQRPHYHRALVDRSALNSRAGDRNMWLRADWINRSSRVSRQARGKASPGVSPQAVALLEGLLAGQFVEQQVPRKTLGEIANTLLVEGPTENPE